MKLKQIELKKLEIPFRQSFKHASAERSSTETVIACALSEDNIIGYGEGCPRSYVTGESVASCLAFVEAHRSTILKINDIDSLRAFVFSNKIIIDQNPAAWCAIEISILDLLGKLQKKPIETILDIPEISGNFYYTGVLGVSNPKAFTSQLEQYLKLGFNDFKLKVSSDLNADLSNIRAIRKILPNATIRLDANNLWPNIETAFAYLNELTPNFIAVEEPLKTRDYVGLNELAKRLQPKIILDEGLLRIDDLENLLGDVNIWIPNIRISKMGGLIRSLNIAKECKSRGIKFIIGAQVGETSILTRSAISLANTYRSHLIAQEGAYGTYLLEKDITENPIMFGDNGIVNLKTNSNGGLGINLGL
jgi:L-Ala-D/L-Glu epimerase